MSWTIGVDIGGTKIAAGLVDELVGVSSTSVHLRGAVCGDWKWIEDLRGGATRLVRPVDDVEEAHDLAQAEPARARQLASRLQRVLRPATP